MPILQLITAIIRATNQRAIKNKVWLMQTGVILLAHIHTNTNTKIQPRMWWCKPQEISTEPLFRFLTHTHTHITHRTLQKHKNYNYPWFPFNRHIFLELLQGPRGNPQGLLRCAAFK